MARSLFILPQAINHPVCSFLWVPQFIPLLSLSILTHVFANLMIERDSWLFLSQIGQTAVISMANLTAAGYLGLQFSLELAIPVASYINVRNKLEKHGNER